MTNRTAIFSRLFGIALVAHVVGNWTQPDIPAAVGWINLAVGTVGAVLALKPNRSVLLAASALVVVSVLLEMPFTGNHWVVAALVAMAILVTRGQENLFVPSARWILLIFYGFAAFAKLNSGFFDPSVSCAVFYANQSFTSFGLPEIDPASPLAVASIWLTVCIEFSVPALLTFKRTRYFGVLLGSAFHVLISFDLDQHFFDFTAVLLPLFFLFLPDDSVARFSAKLGSITARTPRLAAVVVGAIMTVLVAISVLTPTEISVQVLSLFPFLLWIPASLFWMYLLWLANFPGQQLRWKPGIAGLAIMGLAVLNGLTPYTEVKTGYGFNMYANLLTAGGVSNHFLIRRTIPLRDGYGGPVEVLSSSDSGLELYHDLGYLVANPQLRRYLTNHPDVSLTYVRHGQTISLSQAADDPELVDPGPWWWRFFPLRAIDKQNPPRCQDVFLVAL